MKIQIKATGIQLTDVLTDYVNKKVSHLEKFIDAKNPDTVCHVELAKTTEHHKNGDIYRAEIRCSLKNGEVYVAEERADLHSAIDAVKDEAYNKLSSMKDKAITRIRKGGAKVKAIIKGMWGADK